MSSPKRGAEELLTSTDYQSALELFTTGLAAMEQQHRDLRPFVGKELSNLVERCNCTSPGKNGHFDDMGYALKLAFSDNGASMADNNEIQKLRKKLRKVTEEINRDYHQMCDAAMKDYSDHMKKCSEDFLAKYEQ
jgi:hypothetical protein